MKKQIRSLLAMLLVLLAVGAVFYSFNTLTPLCFDDYTYSHSWATGQRIASLGDIFESLYAHYFRHSGRAVTHFFAHLFLMLPKGIFNVVNTLVFLGMGLLMYHFSGFETDNHQPWFLAVIFILVYGCCPAFGEGFLWITGSSNYLFSMVLLLLGFLPYYRHLAAPGAPCKTSHALLQALGMFLLCFLGGASHESNAAAILCMAFLVILISLFRKDCRGWMFSGFLGFLAGFVFMALSPGSGQRAAGEGSFLLRLIQNALDITRNALDTLSPLLILYLCVLILFLLLYREHPWKEKLPKLLPAGIFLIGALADGYSMAAAPYFPSRAWDGPVILLIISLGCILKEIDFPSRTSPKLTNLATGAIALCILFHCAGTHTMLEDHFQQYENRVASIQEQKAAGARELYIPAIYGDSRFSVFPDYGDIFEDPAYWTNVNMAIYYKVDRVHLLQE